MKLVDLFKEYSWEVVEGRLLELYPDEEKNLEGYEYVFLVLPTLEEEDTGGMRLCISSANNADLCDNYDEVWDKSHMHLKDEWEDVHGKNGELFKDLDGNVWTDEEGNTRETTWALEFSSFNYWASMEIDEETLLNYTTLDIVCHALWEMTFCGFMQEQIDEKKAELDRRCKEIDDGTVETIPWEEVKKRLEEEFGGEEDENSDT